MHTKTELNYGQIFFVNIALVNGVRWRWLQGILGGWNSSKNNSCRCFPRVYMFTVHKEPVYVKMYQHESETLSIVCKCCVYILGLFTCLRALLPSLSCGINETSKCCTLRFGLLPDGLNSVLSVHECFIASLFSFSLTCRLSFIPSPFDLRPCRHPFAFPSTTTPYSSVLWLTSACAEIQ